MKWLLIMWAASYGFDSTPVLYTLDTKEQCQAVMHIAEQHGLYRDEQCIPLPANLPAAPTGE